MAKPVSAPFKAESMPTVLLVHGAFADTSLWHDVILELRDAGVDAIAVANPLRSLESDSAYVANVAKQVDGPVVLVAHAYGGAVISNIAGATNVLGLVFIAALAPDEGESKVDLFGRFPETQFGPALFPASYPNGHGAEAVEMFLSRSKFAEVFGADLPPDDATAMASSQRPITLAALEEKSGPPAWRDLPSWYLVAMDDQLFHPDAQRFLAARTESDTIEIAASHAVPLSHPGAVARLVLKAVRFQLGDDSQEC